MEESGKSKENIDQNDVAVAAIAADTSAIFKLRADEFHGIFDLLTLDELIAVGETCTRMQTYAGDFFRSNHILKTVDFECEPRLKIFSKFAPKVEIFSDVEEKFRFVGTHCKSSTDILLSCISLAAHNVGHLKPIMAQIETIRMSCIVKGFSHHFLKLFPNLKRLSLRDIWTLDTSMSDNSVWLQRYPALEHLELVPSNEEVFGRIGTFLEQNANIRSFAIRFRFLWKNRQTFEESNAKLNNLALYGEINSDTAALLNKLYSKGFYKRLHLYFPIDSNIEIIAKLKGLKKLFLTQVSSDDLQKLISFKLTEITELGVRFPLSAENFDRFAKNLVNLERLYIENCDYNQIVPFIRHSSYLKKISIGGYNGDVLDLKAWNEERKKLMDTEHGSRWNKLIIFMRAETYLKFKWANKGTSLDCIELRRRESCEWGHNFASLEICL